MACSTGKTEHRTRDDAERAMKALVYANHCHGRDDLSKHLNVYACNECNAWHVGRSSLQTPSCFHFTLADRLDDIVAVGGLAPTKPTRMPKSLRRHSTGGMLALLACVEERAPHVWFTWDPDWNFTNIPHPGVFLPRPADESADSRVREGIIRIAVGAHVAKLRWCDYIKTNQTPRVMRGIIGRLGQPGQWLATDQPVPSSTFRLVDTWYRDRWIAIDDVDEGFDAWLMEPLA